MPRTNHRVINRIARKILSLCGWKIKGELPEQKKFILAVAPHTSNWDFLIGIAVMLTLNLKLSFLGKDSIFIGPFGTLLRNLGGIAVERTHRHGVVGQMVEEFNQREQMILGLAPEGTRRKTKQWKTGFLIIAQQAKVPVLPVSLDFSKREVNIMPSQTITEDIEQELVHFKRHFENVCAKNPHSV